MRKVFILFFLAASMTAHAQFSGEIKTVAAALADSMTELQQKRAIHSMDDSIRTQWNNLPLGLRARAGLNIGAMSVAQRKLLHRLLSASLSSQGYLKSTSIIQLDNLLNIMYDTLLAQGKIDQGLHQRLRDLQWDYKNFYLAFFGDPRKDQQWGFKLEGHHLSLNFTSSGNRVSVTPFFMGTDPAEYPILEYAGLRVLGQEQDLGIRLILSMSDAQRKKATKDTTVPGDIITAAESGKRLIEPWGIRGSELNTMQKDLLMRIVKEYVYNLEWDKANEEYDKIMKAGVDKIYFGWIGSYDEQKPHYFLVNGPGFLIEFDNPRNHIHTIWREKGNEYGEDILKKHYQSTPH